VRSALNLLWGQNVKTLLLLIKKLSKEWGQLTPINSTCIRPCVWRIWCSDVYGVVVVLEGMIMVDE
jgi:hypothetical protein